MKIYNNDQIQKSLYPETKIKTNPSVGKEFGSILKETVENTQKTGVALQQTTVTNSMLGVQPIPSSILDKQFTVERIEKFINLLDQYRQQLADPSITLKKIDPIIKEVAQEKESLTPVLDSLLDGEELKKILNQTLVTASLEVTKFYRGDYITG